MYVAAAGTTRADKQGLEHGAAEKAFDALQRNAGLRPARKLLAQAPTEVRRVAIESARVWK
jgi:hypothetical protein